MKFLIVLCVLAFAAGAFARPAEKQTQKFPKKFDESLHSLDRKKIDKKGSSYSIYDVSKVLDIMRPPPQIYERGSYREFIPRIPGFVFNPQVDSPRFLLTAPVEDTYSNPEGVAMEGLEFPSDSQRAQSNSYTKYNVDDTDRIHLIAPASSSYSMLSLTQLEEPVELTESALPSSDMQPPTDTAAEEPKIDSSYTTYDSKSKSTYLTYDQSEKNDGEKLKPPPVA